MNDKLLTLLGFASKAGKLAFGMNATISSIITGKSRLLIMSGELSAKSRKEIIFHANKTEVPYEIFEDLDIITLSNAVGRKCGIISVNDSSFADAMAKIYMTGGNAYE